MKNRIASAAVCLLLALGLLVLAGCGVETAEPTGTSANAGTTVSSTVPVTTEAPTTIPPTTEAPQPSLTGLVAVEGLEITEDEGIFGLCSADGMGFILLQHWDEQANRLQFRLAALDPKTAALAEVTELDACPGDIGFNRVTVTETEILLIDEYGERCGAFDRAGTFLELRDYPTMSRENRGWQNRLLNDDCFWKNADYAFFTDNSGREFSQLVAFYDEADGIHALKEPCDAVETVTGHRLLTRFLRADDSLAYTLLDLDGKIRLGEAVFRPDEVEGGSLVNPCGSAIGTDWVLLAVEWSGTGGNCRRVLFWYPGPEQQTPLDEEILTEQILTDRIAALKAEMEPLGLTFHLDEAPAPEQTPTLGLNESESVCDVGASLFGQYRILSRLKEFTEKLPEGFIREIYSQMPDQSTDRDGLHIFVVRNIPGIVAGFANTWTEPMMICFATEEFDDSHLAHEFMHILDYRLNQYASSRNRDFETEWSELSPYWAYDEWLTGEQEREVSEYFVSFYARTNFTEDRAETFQRLFDCTEPLEQEWWYVDYPKVQAKVAYLVELLREAFPSVQAVEKAWWEKLPD